MKKILLTILIFCCTKFILVAQENVRSTLTLLTTDLMRNNIKNNFNWLDIHFNNLSQNLAKFPCYHHQLPAELVTDANGEMWEDTYQEESDCSRTLVSHVHIGGGSGSGSSSGNGNSSGDGNTNGGVYTGMGAGWGWGIYVGSLPSGLSNPNGNWNGIGGGNGGVVKGGSVPPPNQPTDPTGSMSPPKRKDTLAPIIKPCNDTANKIGDSLTRFMTERIDTTWQMQYLKDSCATKLVESGIRVRAMPPFVQPYTKFKIDKFVKDGLPQGADLTTDQYTYMTFHNHAIQIATGSKQDECPSTKDIFLCLENISEQLLPLGGGTFGPKKVKFFTMINMHNGTKNQYALAASDTTAVNNFYNPVTESQYLDTNHSSPHFNNWVGHPDSLNTPLGMFQSARDEFKKEGYPEEKLNTYANVYMLKTLNIPLKIYSRDSGGIFFKELNFTTVDTIVKGKKQTHFRIKICN